MPNYISINPKLTRFDGVTDPDEQILHAYRSVTLWLTAALIEHGPLHLSRQSLDAAVAHLESCDEMPTFRVDQFAEGCESIELVRFQSPDATSPSATEEA